MKVSRIREIVFAAYLLLTAITCVTVLSLTFSAGRPPAQDARVIYYITVTP